MITKLLVVMVGDDVIIRRDTIEVEPTSEGWKQFKPSEEAEVTIKGKGLVVNVQRIEIVGT